MAIKVAWTLAILAAFMMTVVPPVRAGQPQAVSVGSSCNSLDGDLTIVGVDNRPVINDQDLRDALSKRQPDNRIYLTMSQLLPDGARKTIKIALNVGNKNQTVGSGSTITSEQNAPQSEDYYEMISGCVNCVIPGVALGGVNVQLVVNEDDSVAPPVKRGLFSVTAPAQNTPADRSGLRPSDQVVKINGVPVGNMTVTEAIKRLREPKGSDVTLTMGRTVGPDESFTVTLPRW
jgi:C-terminal processing protease CtpA/Prc